MPSKKEGLAVLFPGLKGEQLQVSFRQTIHRVTFDLRRSIFIVSFLFFLFLLFLLEGKKVFSHFISRGMWENPAEQTGALQSMPVKSLSTEITFPFKPVKKV